MTSRRILSLIGAVLLASPANAAPGDIDVVRDLAARMGPIIGSALACEDIARRRVQTIADKFSRVIREASSVNPTASRWRGCSSPMSPPAASS